jgi:SNF2 family DNA or RNA helicase
MRMLSSHPRLLLYSADDFDSEVSRRGSQYASELRASGILDALPERHTKLDALVEHITEILDEDPRHKVVVFSYFKPMLRMIATELMGAITTGPLGGGLTMITGDVAGQERDRRIQRFNNDPACRVFLSSDAGAYGVDLNQGSHLICYDLPWSAGALAQRISRIDRTNSAFGQINIGYMFGLDTIEERMYNMLQQKRKVSRAFIDGEYDMKTGGISLDLQSLREFLDA